MHLTEGRNTGFKKILDALKINGSPQHHSYFITRLYAHEAFLEENELKKSQKGAKKEPKRSQKGAKKEPKGNKQYLNYWDKILQ